MDFGTVIEVGELVVLLGRPEVVVVDCRFSLADTEAGEAAYQAAHIPGAVYAHLDRDLSGLPDTDYGRHPLPSPQALRELFGRLGIVAGTQVVAYDDASGPIAARLWWLLRYMGHDRVAVLDGGWPAWQAAGHAVRSGVETNAATEFRGEPRVGWLVTAAEVPKARLLVDSRAESRYRGEEEPLDRIGGHIPGAVNRHFELNWADDGRFRSAGALRTAFESLLGMTAPEQATFYCGSGVTACNNLLALAHGGLGDGRLYAGSWSDWIHDPERPVASGDD